ncbi:acyltransferase family protein [Brevundimonas sp.]|uniref:acyltransferase family protein n=1 Tax=Brevundimonas sp. TaxID=1871086 RepID=UPI0035B2B88B
MNPPAPAHLKPLTSMRFLAALWVVFYAWWPNLDTSWTSGLVQKGYLGVELFFVLSGFILCHVYLAAAETGRFRYGSFLWARLARVWPLHLATLFGVIALGLGAAVAGMDVAGGLIDWMALPAHLTMTHAWGLSPSAAFNHPSWSVSAEWFAYLSFPAFAAVAMRVAGRPRLALGAATLALMATYAVFEAVAGFALTAATFQWGALRIVPCFLLGCFAYLIYRQGPLPRPGVAALLLTGCIALAALGGLWDGIIVALFAPLILALASLDDGRAGVMESRPAVYLGEVSYAVYMVAIPWQLVAVNLAERMGFGVDGRLHILVWSALVAAIVPVAMVAHHLVERPARRWMRGMESRRASRSRPGNIAQQSV